MQLIMETADGTSLLAEHVTPENASDTLKRARRSLFGRRGKINYTDLTVTMPDAVVRFVSDENDKPTP